MLARMRKRHSRGEIAAFLAEREREGLSYAELSRRTGMRATTLSWWSWRLRRDRRRPSFLEVEEVAPPVAGDSGVVIELPGGLRVHVSRTFDDNTLARLLDMIAQRC